MYNLISSIVPLNAEPAPSSSAPNVSVFVVTAVTQSHDVKLDDMDQMEEADRKLNEIRGSFHKANIPCEVRVLVNDLEPGESLIQFADEKDIEQIVIGIRKRSKVGKLIFGSTAQYVILEAKCPVLTVK